MDILLNVFKYLLQILTERDAEIEALKKDKSINLLYETTLKNIQKICMTALHGELRHDTVLCLEGIIRIIDKVEQIKDGEQA